MAQTQWATESREQSSLETGYVIFSLSSSGGEGRGEGELLLQLNLSGLVERISRSTTVGDHRKLIDLNISPAE